ncbi:hypothetical protein V8D89_006953 [Ganoderma adspersum]
MSLSDAERITLVNNAYTTNLLTVGMGVLIGYDYILTIRREARLFWKPKVNAASLLFFVNRYLAVFYYVGLAYYRCLDLPFPGCQTQDYIDISLRYLEYLPWAVFSALRVHALSQRNWYLTSFTFVWAMVAFPLDYYGAFHHRYYIKDPYLGCASGAATPTFLSEMGSMFIRGGQIIGDVVVIGVTWRATYRAHREGYSSRLLTIMFRNGTLYFFVLLALNILQMLFIFLPNTFLHIPLTNTSWVPKFSEPITTILISRFILDLHETNRAMAHGDLTALEIMSSDMVIAHPSSEGAMSTELEDWSVNTNPTWNHKGSEGTFGSTMVSSSTVSEIGRLNPA